MIQVTLLITFLTVFQGCRHSGTPEVASGTTMVEPMGHQRILELEKAVSASTAGGGWFTSASWSADGTEIAASGGYPETDIFRASTLSLVKKLDGGPKGFAGGSQHSVAFSADGRLLVSGALIATLWDTASWQQKLTLIGPSRTEPPPFGIKSIVFSPNQQLVVVAYQSAGHLAPIVAYRVRDGSIAWTYHLQATIGLPSIRTPLVTNTARNEIAFGTREGTPDVAIDASGHYVGTDSRKLSRIVILDALSGKMLRSIDDIQADYPTALAISSDGRWLATGTVTDRLEHTSGAESHSAVSIENKVGIWSVVSGALVMELAVHMEVQALEFSPDARYLVGIVSESPGHLNFRIWDADSGSVVQVLPIPRQVGAAFGLAFSPDGSRLVAVGQGIAILGYQPGPSARSYPKDLSRRSRLWVNCEDRSRISQFAGICRFFLFGVNSSKE
jgi:WD40 repeat protein